MSPDAPPRFTSRPPTASSLAAAVAGMPKTGSRMTSYGPWAAKTVASTSTSEVSRGSTTSAPAACARATEDGRASAITSAAPSTRATPIPACPTAPPPPSTSTRSAAASRALQVSAIQAATPESPSAAASGSETSAAMGTTSTSGTAHSSARDAVAGLHAGRREEPHPAPGLEGGRRLHRADALTTRYVRRPWDAEVRRTARAQQVERHHRGSRHVNDGHPLAALGRRVLAVHGSQPRCVQDRGLHVAMSGYGRVRCFMAWP